MAVNKDFYAMINELVERASSGTVTGIVDYSTFIDRGRTLSSMSSGDFGNAFISALMNKVQLVINNAKLYNGAYNDLYAGNVPANGIIEVITHHFYEAEEAAFANLVNGQSVDHYVVHKPVVDVDYFVNDNAFQIPITIQTIELVGAWNSPEAMNGFISSVIDYVSNSVALQREQGRIALVADKIIELSSATAATSPDVPAQRYKLLTMYNAIAGTELTADNCLYNSEFVRFAIATIKKVKSKLQKVSSSYSTTGNKTFTPAEDVRMYLNSALSSAMEVYVFPDYYNNETLKLDSFVDVPFWQNEQDPLRVSYAASDDVEDPDDETKTAKTVAVLFDKGAIGEYLAFERMVSTPLNARGEYYNNFFNVQTKLVNNKRANAVIFTLE